MMKESCRFPLFMIDDCFPYTGRFYKPSFILNKTLCWKELRLNVSINSFLLRENSMYCTWNIQAVRWWINYVWKTFKFLNLDRKMKKEEDKLRHCIEIQFRRIFLQAKQKISIVVFRTHAMMTSLNSACNISQSHSQHPHSILWIKTIKTKIKCWVGECMRSGWTSNS